MIMHSKHDAGPLSIVVVDIGNTTTRVARWIEGEIDGTQHTRSNDAAGVNAILDSVRSGCENQTRQAIVIASVVPAATEALSAHIETELNLRPFVVGGNTPLPVESVIENPESVGADRVCSAAAAFQRTGHACTVIDVGSAVTVDAIDDNGVFLGGAILPGIALQARALHEATAKLPLVDPIAPASALGRNTNEAIAAGLIVGIAGAIRAIVEQIATELGAWPQTVLTGGGAELLKDRLDFVDSWVPDLCLMGVGLAYMKRVAREREVQP